MSKYYDGRLYSPSLKDVVWLEDPQLIFLTSHRLAFKFGWVDVVCEKKT